MEKPQSLAPGLPSLQQQAPEVRSFGRGKNPQDGPAFVADLEPLNQRDLEGFPARCSERVASTGPHPFSTFRRDVPNLSFRHSPNLTPRPLAIKHSRYSWNSRKGQKQMTIAAGFMHKSGIILCSDTQQEGGATKYHGPKAGIIDIPYGKIAFAFAGSSDFATTAIQSCGSRLKSVAPDDTIRVLTEEVESEYRRLIFSHPCYATDPNLPYWLLIALWQKATDTCSLWVTQEHSLHSCFESFRAVGIGTDLANVLMRPFITDRLSELEALTQDYLVLG
jgi:hypothetical protein